MRYCSIMARCPNVGDGFKNGPGARNGMSVLPPKAGIGQLKLPIAMSSLATVEPSPSTGWLPRCSGISLSLKGGEYPAVPEWLVGDLDRPDCITTWLQYVAALRL